MAQWRASSIRERAFERCFGHGGSVLKTIRETGDLDDETTKKLDTELEKFKKAFNIEEESVI